MIIQERHIIDFDGRCEPENYWTDIDIINQSDAESVIQEYIEEERCGWYRIIFLIDGELKCVEFEIESKKVCCVTNQKQYYLH